MEMPQSDAERLRHTYLYDPDTGQFRWNNPPPKMAHSKGRPGDPAGTVDLRRGTLMLRFDRKLQQASRLAWLYMTGEWPQGQVLYRDVALPLPERDRFSNLKMAGAEDLTADRLRQLIDYDPELGVFKWKAARKGVKAGAVTGNVKNVRAGSAVPYVRIDGLDYPAQRIAWLYVHGEWPSSRIAFKDHNPKNCAIGNLYESGFEHGTRQTPTISDEDRKRRQAETYRRSDLKRKFDLTEDEYMEMHRAQDGRCAICGQPETATRDGKLKWLAVDHHHGSGAVRQLLCAACNVAVGLMQEDPTRFRAAADYLDRHVALVAEEG